jgi:DNA-binding CsgD family transcriptional regulator
MTPSISGTVSAQPAYTPTSAPAATQEAPQPEPSADTVTLSQSAQVIQLNQQGQIPSQIAANLGIPVSTVDSDLGIAAATGTSKPPAAPVVAAPAATSTKSTSAA